MESKKLKVGSEDAEQRLLIFHQIFEQLAFESGELVVQPGTLEMLNAQLADAGIPPIQWISLQNMFADSLICPETAEEFVVNLVESQRIAGNKVGALKLLDIVLTTYPLNFEALCGLESILEDGIDFDRHAQVLASIISVGEELKKNVVKYKIRQTRWHGIPSNPVHATSIAYFRNKVRLGNEFPTSSFVGCDPTKHEIQIWFDRKTPFPLACPPITMNGMDIQVRFIHGTRKLL